MANATIWADLHALGAKAAKRFGLPKAFRLAPLPKRSRCKIDGDCSRRGSIRLRVHRYHRPNQALKRSTILATFAHELAHLREWEHGAAHRALAREIAEWIREQGHPVSARLFKGTYPRRTKRRK